MSKRVKQANNTIRTTYFKYSVFQMFA